MHAKLAYSLLDVPFTAWARKSKRAGARKAFIRRRKFTSRRPRIRKGVSADYTRGRSTPPTTGRLQQGEDVQVDPATGRVQVSGQVAVMMINGLLCKVIFDHNPTNEFYVEESFPLEWMYPYETPFGIIMKINRNPHRGAAR